MARFTVQHRYGATRDGRAFGPWAEGETVELDDLDAEWVERDSPGALVAEQEKASRQAPPKADRQARGGRNRGA